MKVTYSTLLLAVAAPLISAHAGHSHSQERTWSADELDILEKKWGTDFGFSGINTFGMVLQVSLYCIWNDAEQVSIAHLPHFKCLTQPRNSFDIGIIGAPFDTAVSYRPGKFI